MKKSYFKRLKKNPSYFNDINSNIYEQDNCVIFITLDKEVGKIIKYTREFTNLFGY